MRPLIAVGLTLVVVMLSRAAWWLAVAMTHLVPYVFMLGPSVKFSMARFEVSSDEARR